MTSPDYAAMIPKASYSSQPTQGFEERGTEEQIAKLYAALSTARVNFGKVERSEEVSVTMKSGGKYKFKYAPMENLLSATTRALSDQGLIVMLPFTRAGDKCVQWAIIAHKDGGRLTFSFEFSPKADEKDFGGQTTYFQRYAYRSALSLAADEDMDNVPQGERGEAKIERKDDEQARPQQQSRQPEPARQAPQQQRTPPSQPPPAQGEGLQHAATLKSMQDALRTLGMRTKADAAPFIYKALNVPAFPLGDPLGSSLNVSQMEKVINAAIEERAKTPANNAQNQ